MYLKNLTVFGFKSFADKTSLNFQPGVTAIVGPNGCGKSNVSDAIRWVLGEQSAKALRGGEMADVIFNGTDTRKALGLAEVSLTIGGVDEEHLRAAGVELAYNEVTLTRRIFRDGGSEYFINKTPSRLKDIQQLFMGTGVGRTSYSIMAQGHITQLISSRPDDRRAVFEEAAGITKFKSQRKECLRKLEHTDQNLLRVQDLIKEVKRQIGSLQRQAGKARRYKQFMVELQHLETQLARHQFDILTLEIQSRQENSEKLRVEMEICTESVARDEGEILQLRARLTELDAQITTTQHHALELKAQVGRDESRIAFNEERLRQLEEQNTRALAEITAAEERHTVSTTELASVTERLAASQSALDQHRGVVKERRDAQEQVERELQRVQDALRKSQSDAFATTQSLSRARNEINALDLQKQGNLIRLEKLAAEKTQLEEERTRLEQRLTEFETNVEAEKLGIQTQRGTVEQRQKRLREIQVELNQAAHDLDALVRPQAEKRSRLSVLEQLVTSHEGFSAGALAALKQSQSVLGSLTDRIRVPDQYVLAVESALGVNLQLVLTNQPEAAEGILADLSTNKRGKASVAALALLAQRAPETPPEPPAAELGIRAATIVECDDAVRPLIDGLLGRIIIVADVAAATRAWRDTHGAWDFVTETGDLLTRHGVYAGGATSGSGKAASSILGRKNQIAELKTQLEQLQEQINEASRRKGSLQSEQTELQATLQQAQTQLRAQEVAIATRQGEFNALKNSQRSLIQKIENVGYELKNLTAHDQEGLAKRATLAARIAELETTEQGFLTQVATQTAGLDSLRLQRDTAVAALSESKVALASEEQLCASLTRQKAPLEQRLRELLQHAQSRRQEVSSFVERKTQYETDITELRRNIERVNHEREQVNVQVGELARQKTEQEAAVAQREEMLRERRARLTEQQKQRGALDVELAQKSMSVQNLRERIQQKYQLHLDDIRSECITITIADEGPPKIQTLTPEEMAAAGVATDWDTVAAQVTVLQKKIDEIGPVNLVAIEEYEETEQRFTFLSTQNDDLVKAKEQLLEVINRINSQTKEMFVETFNKVRDNFRILFTEIFGGGSADLQLVDEGDVLESGIEIFARPPGKKLQSITLLSGGEQTMTAVALLFAIYQVRPSPFCVLDELDAPLDESNISRFVRVLQRFLVHSQFVIITHNKRTIGMADVLYGVTMQEHGVSKIVSVKFHKNEEPVTDHTPTPLVPPPTVPPVEREEDAPHKKEETLEISTAQ